MKRRPDKLRIIGKSYEVQWVDVQPIQGSYAGYNDSTRGLMQVSTDQSHDQLRDALLHEIIHALDYELKLELGEETVTRLACVILAVLRDNPGLAGWLVS